MSASFHEDYNREKPPLPSDRSTGLVFVAVALIVALIWRTNTTVLYAALATAAVLLAVSLLAPSLLRPLNIAWMWFAHQLSRVMNPLVMFILFAVVVVPAGLIMRLRYDPLHRRRDRSAKTYWRDTDASARASDMTNQF